MSKVLQRYIKSNWWVWTLTVYKHMSHCLSLLAWSEDL